MRYLNILLILLCLLFSSVSGQTYYFDATGGNDGNTGLSPSQAWASITKLSGANAFWNSIGPGDSLLFKRGEIWNPPSALVSTALIGPTYNKAGTVNQPIYIGVYGTGAKPILSAVASGAAQVFFFYGAKYFTVDSLEIRGRIRLQTSASYPLVSYIKLRDLKVNLQGASASNGAIEHENGALNTELDNGTTHGEYWLNWWADHIEIARCSVINAPTTALKFWMGRYFNIHHNYIYKTTGGSGIDFGEGNCDTIEYNQIYLPSGMGIKMQAQRYTQDSLVIRGNVIHGNVGNDMACIILYQSRYSQIYNNTLVARTNYIGISHNSAIGTGWTGSQPVYFCGVGTWGIKGCLFANNIFFGGIHLSEADNVGLVYRFRSDTVRFKWTIDSLMIHNTWRNNITWRGGGDLIRIRYRDWGSQTYEHYWPSGGTCPYPGCHDPLHPAPYYQWTEYSGTSPFLTHATSSTFNTVWNNVYPSVVDELDVDPQLFNPNGTVLTDFIPKTGSPTEEAGYKIAGWTQDIRGRTIPVTAVPDIGAFYTGTDTVIYEPDYDRIKKLLIRKP